MRGAGREDRQGHRRQRAVPVLVFLLTLAVTAVVWVGASQYIHSRDLQRLENERHRIDLALTGRIESQISLLRNTAAMFVTQREVTEEEFRRFVAQIGLTDRYQGIQGLGYAARVPAPNRSAFEQATRSRGTSGFRIFPSPKEEAWAITMLEPLDVRNRRAIGFDMRSDPIRRAAMERAVDQGSIALTSRVRLVQETEIETQPGFLMYCPLYRGGEAGDAKTRRERLVGFVYSPFRARDFFHEIFRLDQSHQMWVEIFDGEATSNAQLLFRNLPRSWSPGPETVTRPIRMAGHTWTVRYIPRPELTAAAGDPLVQWIPIGGLFLGLLLAALSYGQVRTNDVLVAQTEELRRREFAQGLLARTGEQLAKSLDVDQNLEAVASLVVPSFADWCSVDVKEWDGTIRRVAVAHVDPGKVRWADDLRRRFPPDPDAEVGVPQVLRTGKPELYREMPTPLLDAGVRDESHRRLLEEAGFASVMIVPMIAHDRVIGAMTFTWAESGHHYGDEDLELAQEIGARAAVAVENARLFADREHEIEVRAAAEARVREMNEDLERMVQERTRELTVSNQELEAFCYSVSHDLRSPLRSVDGFSKALLEDYGERLDEEGRRYLERVRQAARRMDELITALLALSRLTRAELHVQAVDLSEIAREAADDVRRADDGKRVDISVEPNLEAEADPRMVRIVFDNLIGNAVKFSARSAEPQVEIGRTNNAYFVRDNGVGFNPAYSNKLFAPFERLHSTGQFPGTGIGLATVQRIVARHGGHVWADSEEGKGATFYFTLQ
ncbi:MAG: CHASE domain-containing protein [Fimbriimonas sp.]